MTPAILIIHRKMCDLKRVTGDTNEIETIRKLYVLISKQSTGLNNCRENKSINASFAMSEHFSTCILDIFINAC